jgi:hypothetical protein
VNVVKIASERSINRSFYYSSKIKGFKKELPLTSYSYNDIAPQLMRSDNTQFKTKSFICSDFLDLNCFKFIDVITDKFLKSYYYISNKGTIPLSPYDSCSFKKTEEENAEIFKKCPVHFYEFSDQQITNSYGFVFNNNITNSVIFNIIDKLSKCKFNLCFDYRLYKLIDNKPKVYYLSKSNIDEEPMHLFEYEVVDQVKGKNDKIYERLYKISFNNWLGIEFLDNIKSVNIDWIPSDYYNLSAYPQMFYRFFILTEGSKGRKLHLKNISFLNIKEKLGLVTENKSYISNFVKSILDILVLKKIVKKYELKYNSVTIHFKK